MSENAEDTALNHATKHFEIHAAQRLTAFNFFIVISGAILAAIAASIQKPEEFALPGAALGVLLAILSAIFWKLDRRTRFLIKHSESAIKKYEAKHLDPEFRVFSNEECETEDHRKSHKFSKRMFSYSEVFGLLFLGSGLLGMAGAIVLTFSPQLSAFKSQRLYVKVNKASQITNDDCQKAHGEIPTSPKPAENSTGTAAPKKQT